ncbi:MAG: membrane protein insertase YidC [Candidatus Aegiribacteria sp.]|nr:membrane protein insertase YidC [Candidatus Aegiribacteria sp.]
MSDQKRLLLAAALMAAVLFISWQFMGRSAQSDSTQDTQQSIEYVQQEQIPAVEDSASVGKESTEIISEKVHNIDVEEILPEERVIKVIVYDGCEVIVEADISTAGGTVIGWKLPQYEDMPGAGNGECINFDGNNWTQNSRNYETSSEDTIIIDEIPQTLVLHDPSGGGEITYTFTPGRYGFLYETDGFDEIAVLNGGILPVSETNSNPSRYFKAQWNAEKVKNRNSNDITGDVQVGNVEWIAARSQYFAIIMMPQSYERAYGYLFASEEDKSPSIGLQDNRIFVYAGPLDYGRLRSLGRDTSRLVDFGWPIIRDIGRLLFWFCTSILSFVSNWGIKIVLLAIVLKLVLMPLTTKSFKSMAMLKQVQPKMKELQEKYKKDPKALQSAMQKLYREEGVNPLGGCLPLIMQMPVFFALYRVLANSVQLRGAPFILWIKDLSKPEILIPFQSPVIGLHGIGLLAVLMGIAMFLQQKMTMTDQNQKGMMYMMPIFMTFLFMRFPAGLTMYWFSNSLLTIWQQQFIKKKLETVKN